MAQRRPEPDDWSHRLRWVAAQLRATPAEAAALTVLVAGAVAALGLLWFAARPSTVPAAPPVALAPTQVVVHVAGRVRTPGLYRLPGGARIADALDAAGGARPGAALDTLNLARPLDDGEQLVVPGPGVRVPASGGDGSEGGAATTTTTGSEAADGLLDLNSASASELEELPGVGEVLAERIITQRDAAGGFKTVEELQEVPGIGDKTYAELAPLVRV